MTSSAFLARAGDPGTVDGPASTGDLVSKDVLESNGDPLSIGVPETKAGLSSTCGPWCTGGLGRCGGPGAEDALGTEGVQQKGVVRLRGSCLRMETYPQVTCCSPGAGHFVGPGHDPGTLPVGHAWVAAFAETAAVKTVTGEGAGRWRTVEAGSEVAAAAVHDAAEQKTN